MLGSRPSFLHTLCFTVPVLLLSPEKIKLLKSLHYYIFFCGIQEKKSVLNLKTFLLFVATVEKSECICLRMAKLRLLYGGKC